jgi:AbrB family looped-hinge helix DNA binding protein
MKSTIDKAGRLVVPKAIRKAARLEPGTQVEMRLVAGRVEIEPVPIEVNLERRGGLVVAVPSETQPELAESKVKATIDAVREGREPEPRS